MEHSRPEYKVFICYRTEDTLGQAAHLYNDLEARLMPGQVFIAHESIQPGQDFTEELRQAAEHAVAMLVLIGTRWLEPQRSEASIRFDARGSPAATGAGEGAAAAAPATKAVPEVWRRLDREEDWVRQEVEIGLRHEIEHSKVAIPVLVDGAAPIQRPTLESIPSVAPLADVQSLRLRSAPQSAWEHDIEVIVDLLVKRGCELRPPPPPPTPFPWKLVVSLALIVALADGGFWVYGRYDKGKRLLQEARNHKESTEFSNPNNLLEAIQKYQSALDAFPLLTDARTSRDGLLKDQQQMQTQPCIDAVRFYQQAVGIYVDSNGPSFDLTAVGAAKAKRLTGQAREWCPILREAGRLFDSIPEQILPHKQP